MRRDSTISFYKSSFRFQVSSFKNNGQNLSPRMNADQRGFLEELWAPHPTCWQVFGGSKIASDPRHYWRRSI